MRRNTNETRPFYQCHGMFTISPEETDFVRRRINGFLTSCGRYSLEHLLSEAYLAGLRDAADAGRQALRSGE